jgi:hypothetical protein
MAHEARLRTLARALAAPIERRVGAVVGRLISQKITYSGLDRVAPVLEELSDRVRGLEQALEQLNARASSAESFEQQLLHITNLSRDHLSGELGRVLDVLQLIYDEEPENRRRLWRLRASEEYEHAFAETEPLVSIVIPTYTNHRALRERSLPSALAQTYANFEVIVVGDAAPAETAQAVVEHEDARIRYVNLERRGPYSEDLHKLWLVGGTPPYNTAVRLARGRWIAYLSDDDSFRPDHLERLVSRAQADRFELCYGLLVQHDRDGGEAELGCFPPAPGQFGFQAAIYHAGLSDFLEFELADAEFGQAVDWGLCRRMLRSGVRMGFVPEPTADYYPSWDWSGRKERHGREQSMSDGQV